jgi:hypothetical protein
MPIHYYTDKYCQPQNSTVNKPSVLTVMTACRSLTEKNKGCIPKSHITHTIKHAYILL